MTAAYEGKLVVSGEFRGTASTGGEITLFNANGVVIDPNGTQQYRLVVTDLVATSSAAGDLIVFIDENDGGAPFQAGEIVARAEVAANGGIVKEFSTPKFGQIGGVPRVTAPSGTVVANINGYLVLT